MKILPSIITITEIVDHTRANPDMNYFTNDELPYYSNIIKRVIAAGYVLLGKGMVVAR